MADDRVIGRDNEMPWHIPEDLAWFKQHTKGHPIIMGKKTFLSLGAALPGRENVVLSRDQAFRAEKTIVLGSLQEAMRLYPNAFIIGGASIFTQALPMVNTMYITHIQAQIPGNIRFPEYDPAMWDVQVLKKLTSECGHRLIFCIYKRKVNENPETSSRGQHG